MHTRDTTGRPTDPPGRTLPRPLEPAPQPCTLCSGKLVMDADGTALFCDTCWDRKWFLSLERD